MRAVSIERIAFGPLPRRAALQDIELATAVGGVSGPVQHQAGIGGPSGFRFGPDASIPPLPQSAFRAEVNSDASLCAGRASRRLRRRGVSSDQEGDGTRS